MTRIKDVAAFLVELAPPDLAEDWDNVGLLTGDADALVDTVLTCLTLTPDVAAEAVERRAGLVVSHHPVLFRPVQRLTAETVEGRMLLELIRAGVAVYSAHTRYDGAAEGINRQLAELFGLEDVRVLRPLEPDDQDSLPDDGVVGAGRFGRLPSPVLLADFIEVVKDGLRIKHVKYVGDPDARVTKVGVACGAAAEFMDDARREGCELLVTGEARFHDCLAARSQNFALILPGHYATERPAMERLAEVLADQFPNLSVTASEAEYDPVQWA